jgi:hypothetical protein
MRSTAFRTWTTSSQHPTRCRPRGTCPTCTPWAASSAKSCARESTKLAGHLEPYHQRESARLIQASYFSWEGAVRRGGIHACGVSERHSIDSACWLSLRTEMRHRWCLRCWRRERIRHRWCLRCWRRERIVAGLCCHCVLTCGVLWSPSLPLLLTLSVSPNPSLPQRPIVLRTHAAPRQRVRHRPGRPGDAGPRQRGQRVVHALAADDDVSVTFAVANDLASGVWAPFAPLGACRLQALKPRPKKANCRPQCGLFVSGFRTRPSTSPHPTTLDGRLHEPRSADA